MKHWLPLLLRNFLQVFPACIHFRVRKPHNREGLMISPHHTLTKQKTETLFMEGKLAHITAPEKGEMSVNWITATEKFQVLTELYGG